METIKSLSVKAKSFKTRLRRLAGEGKWVTVSGNHILLKDGESPMDGFKRVKAGADAWKKGDKIRAKQAQEDADRQDTLQRLRNGGGNRIVPGGKSVPGDLGYVPPGKDKLWSTREKSVPPFVLDVLSRHNTGEKLSGYLKSLPKEKLNKALQLIEKSGSIDAATKHVKDALSAALKDKV